MKSAVLKMMLVVAVMIALPSAVSAQGWLKKLNKTLDTATRELDKGIDMLTAADSTAADTAAVDSVKSIKWDAIPVYTAQKVVATDANGQPLLNEDGTQQYYVFLVDQFGNKRSAEAVKAQQKKLNEAVMMILAKVGGGALIGGLVNGGKGALVGAGVGALASMEDIKMAQLQKKSLKQQKKLLEAYSATFTTEGKPKDASVDLSKVDGLDLKDDNTLSMTTEDIKKELESDSFNTTDDSAWDI